MKFRNLFRWTCVSAAALTLSLSASACSNSTSVPDGDYLGVAVYGSDVSYGYAHLAVTVEAGEVTGTARIYDFVSCVASTVTACSASVPTGGVTETFALTGTVDGTTLDITLTNGEARVVATLGSDGNLSADLIPDDPESGFESYGMIYPDNGSETGIACGSFGFSISSKSFTGTEGGAAFLATEDGQVHGVVASSDFIGTIEGTYDGGSTSCGSSTCDNGITGTLSGTLTGTGTAVSFDIDPDLSSLDFVTAADTTTVTYVSGGADMANADYSGSFGGSSTGCTGAP